MRHHTRVLILLAAFVALTAAACAPDGATVSAGRSADRPGDTSGGPAAVVPPPFTLYVSNQSFEDPTVGITIRIDDVVVVDQDFDVEGQHNWITFEPAITPGEHMLHAISDTGAEFSGRFTIPEGEPRWAVIDYWFYPDEGPRNFTFDISDEPIGFA